MTNLFLKAAKQKFRFETSKGLLNVEQLFELGQQQLHDLYLSLETNIQKSKGLMGRKGNTVVEDKMQIVESVFNSIVEDKENQDQLAENRRMKQVLLEAANQKEVQEMVEGKSAKQLRKAAMKL